MSLPVGTATIRFSNSGELSGGISPDVISLPLIVSLTEMGELTEYDAEIELDLIETTSEVFDLLVEGIANTPLIELDLITTLTEITGFAVRGEATIGPITTITQVLGFANLKPSQPDRRRRIAVLLRKRLIR